MARYKILKELQVESKAGAYPLYIGHGLLKHPTLFHRHIKGPQAFIVTNKRIAGHYLPSLQKTISARDCDVLFLPEGEKNKNLMQWQKILNGLIHKSHHRDTTLIALGGGMIGDLTGFAAACFHRGVDFIQCPTSLLAQVDASIGGKTGVNHLHGKNLIGAFHPPRAVIIDVHTLQSLPEREYCSGLVEVIKAALIAEPNFFAWLEKNIMKLLSRDPKFVVPAIYEACVIKKNIVQKDEKEHAMRAWLNLGHSFGHAFEQILNYRHWLHGEAVARGIVMAADISLQLGWLTGQDLTRIIQIFTQINVLKKFPFPIKYSGLKKALRNDKKILNSQRRLVLLQGIGKPILTDVVSDEKIELAWKRDR